MPFVIYRNESANLFVQRSSDQKSMVPMNWTIWLASAIKKGNQRRVAAYLSSQMSCHWFSQLRGESCLYTTKLEREEGNPVLDRVGEHNNNNNNIITSLLLTCSSVVYK